MIIFQTKSYTDFVPSFRWLIHYPACMIAFGFGAGLAKIMPGTAGTLLAFIPALLIVGLQLPQSYLLILSLVLFLVGVWVSDITEKRLNHPDHSGIVIDEIVAMMLILSRVPVSWQSWLSAFLLFRIFDIWKPWPIRWVDRFVRGGVGVMLDDILAAFYVIIFFILFCA